MSITTKAEGTNTVQQVKHLIAQTIAQRPSQNPEEPINDSYVAFFLDGYGLLWRGNSAFAQLKEVAAENWEDILDNVKEITAPSRAHKIILFMSLYTLPQEDFFLCLNKIADLAMEGVVDQQIFYWTIEYYDLRLHHYEDYAEDSETRARIKYRLSRNYEHPVVAEVIQKAMIIGTDGFDEYSEHHMEYYKKIASGESKKKVEKWEEEDYGDDESEDEAHAANAASPSHFRHIWLWGLALPAAVIVWLRLSRRTRTQK